MKKIFAPVGENGVNESDDVFMVQMLLNHVSQGDGGPFPELEVDGVVGPMTINSIKEFQAKQLGFSDGRVDPGQKTIARLNDFFQPPSAFADTNLLDELMDELNDWSMAFDNSSGVIPNLHRLVYRDMRAEGSKPKGDTVIEVDKHTPIGWVVNSASDVSNKQSGFVRMRIIAHGYGGPSGSHGGGGVEFCKEDILLHNLHNLAPLHGKIRCGVDLYACSVAFITPKHEGKVGDGNVLCSRMAQILGTHVRASTAPQWYSVGPDYRWEGTVLTYGPKGDVVNVEHSPSF